MAKLQTVEVRTASGDEREYSAEAVPACRLDLHRPQLQRLFETGLGGAGLVVVADVVAVSAAARARR
jgi:hypothetical protein